MADTLRQARAELAVPHWLSWEPRRKANTWVFQNRLYIKGMVILFFPYKKNLHTRFGKFVMGSSFLTLTLVR